MWSLLSSRLQVLAVVVPTIVAVQAIEAIADLVGAGGDQPLEVRVSRSLLHRPSPRALGQRTLASRLAPIPSDRTSYFSRSEWDLGGSDCHYVDLPGYRRDSGPDTGDRTDQAVALSTAVQFKAKEATSYSTRCSLEAHRAMATYRVLYSYEHRPTASVRPRNPGHHGFAWLEMDIAADRDRLVGQYFTDRRTTGDIELCWAASDS